MDTTNTELVIVDGYQIKIETLRTHDGRDVFSATCHHGLRGRRIPAPTREMALEKIVRAIRSYGAGAAR